ncbi:hypothetical protein EJ08DRAFT_144844 [Tothia fuscella]|uniref:Uncharacterized protein n=1 Tax=Tothia fuscella TaxID=1048955 RepID=A0A9P4P310_9PEZI|nr:hypothetical protein EJ08DRAFT_144844 [Tothia fuscella]
MSRPYEFSDRDNRVTSPLDRQPQTQYPPGQAPSFATNVNRAKTKKWVEAKKFSYEGDDWGDYDEQDEYGVEAAASQAPPPLPQQQINNSRIFTNPVPAPSQGPGGRRNSYDAGDEKRAFSSSQFPPPGMPGAFEPPPHQAQQGPSRSPVPLHVETSVKPGHTQTSAGSSVYPTTGESARQASATSNDTMYPEHRRDFSPSAMPTPLQTRISPMPSAISQSPASGFPPRRSSVNQNNAPNALPGAMGKSSQESTPISPSKALPFIRPADIYKRMEEEREKERKSLDSQRQSIDSARRQENTSPTGSHNPTGSGSAFGRRPSQESVSERNEGSQLRQPLDTVAERKSEYEMLTTPSNTQTGNTSQAKAPGFTGLALPQIGGESSGFGDEFWESTPLGPKEGNKAAAVPSLSGVDPAIQDSALQHQHSVGFRSMVHEAFDAPAIASKSGSQHSQGTTTNSSFSRSNTTGTSDISPIMSRVPSSAAAAARHAEARDTATPAIAEEPELHHSRNTSEGSTAAKFTPGYRRDLRTPSLDNSPARTPAVENHPELPAPEMARLAMSSPVEADAATKNVIQPLDAASREADIAKVADTNPALAATFEKIAQDSFVDKPQPDIPAYTSRNIARAESPSKGRVADLAGRFNEPPEARRGSVESIGSKKSSGLRPTSSSGVKPPFVERPIAEREISFRPKIPGGFESYMSTASEVPDTTSNATIPPAPIEKDTELTPTTSKHKLEGSTASDVGPMDALAALAAAGAAIGASIRKSMGSEEPESPRSATRAYGDVLNRPLPPDRMESTVSTIPPTPPAKDEEEYAPPVPLKTRERSRSPEISAINTSLPSLPAYVPDSTDATPSGDFESDRLRREIVRSLSPETEGFPAPLPSGPVHTNQAPNRESSAIPSEYESYWATGGDHANDDVGKPDVPNKHAENGLPDLAVAAPSQPSNDYFSSGVEATPRTSSPPPGLLGRKFSWEKSQASLASQATIVSPVAELAKSPNTLEPNKPDPLSLNPKLSGEPLHIVNAEPGELSTPVEPVRRLSEELPPPVPQVPTTKEAAPLPSSEGGLFSQLQARPPPAPQVPATQEFAPLPSSDGGLSSQFGPRPPSGPRPQTGEEPRPANFREILGIKSTPARIAKYDETREQFAKMPTGLDNWLSHTLAANPEYRDVATAVHRPTLSASGGTPVKHKPTSSISRVFTQKSESSGNVGPAPAEYQGTAEQRVSVGKGKDILKTTGVLKGMKEAKGLFAKGKSKFRGSGGEKVDE